jgi:hypothetical protein
LDAAREHYRIVIHAASDLEFDEAQLEPPGRGLGINSAAIQVKDSAGNNLACEAGGYRSAAMSSTARVNQEGRRMIQVARHSTYTGEWHDTKDLFSGFELCAKDKDPRKWTSFKIEAEIETDHGRFLATSGWSSLMLASIPASSATAASDANDERTRCGPPRSSAGPSAPVVARQAGRHRLDLELLKPLTVRKVCAAWGPADAARGSGIGYWAYKMDDGSEVWIAHGVTFTPLHFEPDEAPSGR